MIFVLVFVLRDFEVAAPVPYGANLLFRLSFVCSFMSA